MSKFTCVLSTLIIMMVPMTCKWIMNNSRAILIFSCAKKWTGHSYVPSCPGLAQGLITGQFSKCLLLRGIFKK